MIGVTHIIAGLAPDGAERMLHRLVSGMDSNRFENEVISLTDLGPMTEKFQAAGIRVRALGMSRGSANPYYLAKLAGLAPQTARTTNHSDLDVPRRSPRRSGREARRMRRTGLEHPPQRTSSLASTSATRSGPRRPAPRCRAACRAGSFALRNRLALSTRNSDTPTIAWRSYPTDSTSISSGPMPTAREAIRGELGVAAIDPADRLRRPETPGERSPHLPRSCRPAPQTISRCPLRALRRRRYAGRRLI